MTKITNNIVIIIIYSPTCLPTLNKITPLHKKNRKWLLWLTVYLSIDICRFYEHYELRQLKFFAFTLAEKQTKKLSPTKSTRAHNYKVESDKISIKT